VFKVTGSEVFQPQSRNRTDASMTVPVEERIQNCRPVAVDMLISVGHAIVVPP
jgi:hypothetical protein